MSNLIRSQTPRRHSEAFNESGMGENVLAMQDLVGNAFLRSALNNGVSPATGLIAEGLLELAGYSETSTAPNAAEGPFSQLDVEGTDALAPPICEEHLDMPVEATGDRHSGGGVQLLVGSAFVDKRGVEQPYGHTALRVFDGKGERDVVYDFGRYGATNGRFSAEGEGILREWSHSYDAYLALQNSKGRETTGYTFPASPEEVASAFEMFDAQIAQAELQHTQPRGGGERRIHKLPRDYHGVHNNCTTLSVDGFEQARSDIDLDVEAENQGRGMSRTEKLAAQGIEGWHDEIFMPADLAAVLGKAVDQDVLVERWDSKHGNPYEAVNDPGMTCADPGLALEAVAHE